MKPVPQKNNDQCLLCRDVYPSTGQQVQSPWGLAINVPPVSYKICKRCQNAAKDARRRDEERYL